MENLTYDQFKEFIKKNKLVMATFGAPWCGACRSLRPIVEEIIGEIKDEISNVDYTLSTIEEKMKNANE